MILFVPGKIWAYSCSVVLDGIFARFRKEGNWVRKEGAVVDLLFAVSNKFSSFHIYWVIPYLFTTEF
jgi:hypothetical protein